MNMKQHTIPFQIGKPIQEPNKFIGRREVLKALSNALVTLQNVSLHGERRTGKTSVLLYLAHPASSSAIKLPEKNIPVYFNFEAFADASITTVWQAMVDAIAEQISQHPSGQAESKQFLDTMGKSFISPESVKLFITYFGRALLRLHHSGFKFHLLFDEFEQTRHNPNLRDPFYNALRSLPVRADNISYVIATRTGLAALQTSHSQISSPFFNIFTTIRLAPFLEDDVRHFIFNYFDQAGLDRPLAEKFCDEIPSLHDVTGYHPFFLQMLCYHLFTQRGKPDWPKGKAMQEALQAFEEDAKPYFRYYWNISPKKEQELIEKLAAKNPIDSDFEMAVARNLKERCLLVQAGDAERDLRLFSSAFSKFVSQKANKPANRRTVFISCAREDLEYAKRLYNDLKNMGMKPWLDENDLLPGQQWEAIVTKAIKESDYFIALLSSHSISKQGFVQKELKEDLELLDRCSHEEIFIIPARLDGRFNDHKPNHGKLSGLHWVDLFPSYELGFNKILKALGVEDVSKFVNRKKEIKEACGENALPYILYEAPAGYGKTELLKKIKSQHVQEGWFCVYIEISKSIYSAIEFYKEVAKQAGFPNAASLSDDINEIGSALSDFFKNKSKMLNAPGIILLMDGIEKLPKSEIETFINHFLTAMGQCFQLRIRIAGRYVGRSWKIGHSNHILKTETLSPLPFGDVKIMAQLAFPKQEVSDLCIAHLAHTTGGHPECISLILNRLNAAQFPEDFNQKTYKEYEEIVLNEALKVRSSIPPDLQTAFDVLSVFRRYDYHLLKNIISMKLIHYRGGADKLERALLATRFVKRKPEGFLRDDIVRHLLKVRLIHDNMDRFIELCHAAEQIYEKELRSSTSSRPEYMVIELCYQKLQSAYHKSDKSPISREAFRNEFDEILNRYLKMINEKPDARDIGANLIAILEERDDWEFEFAVNYFLRGGQYNNEPYENMLNQIRMFFDPESEDCYE